MPVNHDEIIQSLCAKAAKVDNVSKKLESKSRVKRSSPQSVYSGASSERHLQKVFDALCAKAKDVAIASKISEASDQFGKLNPSPTTKPPTKVVASLCVKASAFQLYSDDDETATHPDEPPNKCCNSNEFDHESSTTSSSSESEISDQVRYTPRRASITSATTEIITNRSLSKITTSSPITNPPTKVLMARLDASSSTFYLYDDDETATHNDETTVSSSSNQFCNDYGAQNIVNSPPFGLHTHEIDGSPTRIAITSSPTKVASSLGIKGSTFHLFDDDETATNYDESTVGTLSKQFCPDFADQQSSTLGSISEGDDAAMTSEELYELSKSLVTTPSGGSDTFMSLKHDGPPPRVMLNPKSNCDTSITSDLTDWDFGFSKSGSAPLSELDADKVVENFYRMAATDPVLARRIALAATSVIKGEVCNKGSHAMGTGKVYVRGFSTLATVRECEDTIEQTMGKPTRTKPAVSKPTEARRMEGIPRSKPMKPRLPSSTTSDKQRKTTKKIRPQTSTEPHFKRGGFELGSPQSRSDTVGSPQSKKDPPGRVRLDNNAGFCFIQDNPKSHR